MGRSKQALPHARPGLDLDAGLDESLLRHAARAAVESSVHPIVVVLGAEADTLAAQLADQPVHVVAHSGWERGIGSSLKVGLECLTALAPTTDAVIVSVCDQPYLSASVFSRLGRTYRGTDAAIVASAYSGVAGVPALFDRGVFAELYALRDRDGARSLIAREPDRVATVPFPKGAIDLDTPAAYEAYVRGRWGRDR